ncbi:hypothetical protein JCM11491_003630 [Sporobolomyces phaffii]
MARPKRAAASQKKSYVPDSGSEDEAGFVERDSDTVRSATGTDDEGQEYDMEREEEDQEVVQQKKKARTSDVKGKGKAKGQRRSGRLQSMVNLPLDVWFMIAEHLDPQSLLAMGRASKEMRSMFASRSSRGLWNVVKRSVHLPDLESTDLNDLQLTHLIYGRNCYICGKPRAVLVDYCLRMRWCKFCRSKNLVLETRLRGQIQPLTTDTIACSLYSKQGNTNYNWTGKRYHYKAEAIAINDEILGYQQTIRDAKGKKAVSQAKVALKEYVAQRKVIVNAAHKDGKALATWEKSSVADRKAADAAARTARKNAILAKLLELGYEEQDTRTLWKVQHLIDQPTALTSTIWNKISSKIIEQVETTKQQRLAVEASRRAEQRRELVRPYYEALFNAASDKLHFPPFNLFVHIPIVKTLWKEEDSSIDEDIWHSALDEIQHQIPKVARWIKLEFARALVNARSVIDQPLPEALRLSIHDRKQVALDDSVSDVHYPRPWYYSPLDVDDASTISPSELDAFLSRFTSTFSVSRDHDRFGNWIEYYDHHRDSFVDSIYGAVPKHWTRTLLGVLRQTELSDDANATQKLEALGAKFDCECCHDNLAQRSPWAPWPFYGSHAGEKPDKVTGLTWSEMASLEVLLQEAHAVEYHLDAYSFWLSPSVRILYADRKPGSIVERAAPPAKVNEGRKKACIVIDDESVPEREAEPDGTTA